MIEEIKNYYNNENCIKKYSEDVEAVGLWASEQYLFKKYLSQTDKILDLGCGAGRTTINLYKNGFNIFTIFFYAIFIVIVVFYFFYHFYLLISHKKKPDYSELLWSGRRDSNSRQLHKLCLQAYFAFAKVSLFGRFFSLPKNSAKQNFIQVMKQFIVKLP